MLDAGQRSTIRSSLMVFRQRHGKDPLALLRDPFNRLPRMTNENNFCQFQPCPLADGLCLVPILNGGHLDIAVFSSNAFPISPRLDAYLTIDLLVQLSLGNRAENIQKTHGSVLQSIFLN